MAIFAQCWLICPPLSYGKITIWLSCPKFVGFSIGKEYNAPVKENVSTGRLQMKKSALMMAAAVFAVAMSAECAVVELSARQDRETVVNCSRDRTMKRMHQRMRRNRDHASGIDRGRRRDAKPVAPRDSQTAQAKAEVLLAFPVVF